MRALTYIRLALFTSLLLLAGCGTVRESSGSKQAIAVSIPYGSLDPLSAYFPPYTRHVNNFYVLLTNVSGKPVRVWQEWCSWGYYNLQLEIIERDGTKHMVTKKPIGWTVNFPDCVDLAPDASVVWRVKLWPSEWDGLSWLPTNRVEFVKLRAIYTVKTPDNDKVNRDIGVDKMGVWTGRATSKWYDFVLVSQAVTNEWSNTSLEPTPTRH